MPVLSLFGPYPFSAFDGITAAHNNFHGLPNYLFTRDGRVFRQEGSWFYPVDDRQLPEPVQRQKAYLLRTGSIAADGNSRF